VPAGCGRSPTTLPPLATARRIMMSAAMSSKRRCRPRESGCARGASCWLAASGGRGSGSSS
jgi:hypothetical protein